MFLICAGVSAVLFISTSSIIQLTLSQPHQYTAHMVKKDETISQEGILQDVVTCCQLTIIKLTLDEFLDHTIYFHPLKALLQ